MANNEPKKLYSSFRFNLIYFRTTQYECKRRFVKKDNFTKSRPRISMTQVVDFIEKEPSATFETFHNEKMKEAEKNLKFSKNRQMKVSI